MLWVFLSVLASSLDGRSNWKRAGGIVSVSEVPAVQVWRLEFGPQNLHMEVRCSGMHLESQPGLQKQAGPGAAGQPA